MSPKQREMPDFSKAGLPSQPALITVCITLCLREPTVKPVCILCALLLTVSALPAQAAEFISIATGAVTGVYYPAGGAICRLLNQRSDAPRCAVESSAGSRDNLKLLEDGKVDLAIVQSDMLWEAIKGQGEYAGRPLTNLATLFTLYQEPLTLVAGSDSGISDLGDLEGKRVDIGSTGSGDHTTSEALLSAIGWDSSHFAELGERSVSERVSALCSGKIDAFFMVTAHPNQNIADVVERCGATLVPLEGDAVDTLLANVPYYSAQTVPANLYQSDEPALPSFGSTAVVVTRASLPADLAYQLDQVIFSHLEQFKRLHPAFTHLTRRQMLTSPILPLHAGSQAFADGKKPQRPAVTITPGDETPPASNASATVQPDA